MVTSEKLQSKSVDWYHLVFSYTMRVFTERYFRTDYNTEAAAGGVLQK